MTITSGKTSRSPQPSPYHIAIDKGAKKGLTCLYEMILHPLDKAIIPFGNLILDARMIHACHKLRTDPNSYLAKEATPAKCRAAKHNMYVRAKHVKEFVESFAEASGPQKVEMMTTFFVAAALPGTILRMSRFGKLEALPKKAGNVFQEFLRNDAGKVRLPDSIPRTASQKDLIKAYQKIGYNVSEQGKGSHIIMKKEGCPIVTLPRKIRFGHVKDFNKILSKIDPKTLKGIFIAAPLAGIGNSFAQQPSSLKFSIVQERSRQLQMAFARSGATTVPAPREPVEARPVSNPELTAAELFKQILAPGRPQNRARLPKVGAQVPVDRLRHTQVTVDTKVGKGVTPGVVLRPGDLKKSSLSLSKKTEYGEVNVLVNPRKIKRSTISATRTMGKYRFGVVVPRKLKKTLVTGGGDIGRGSVNVTFNPRHPKQTVVSVGAPVYGIPVGFRTPIGNLRAAEIFIGVPGTPLELSIRVRKLQKIARKIEKKLAKINPLFGIASKLRKKAGHEVRKVIRGIFGKSKRRKAKEKAKKKQRQEIQFQKRQLAIVKREIARIVALQKRLAARSEVIKPALQREEAFSAQAVKEIVQASVALDATIQVYKEGTNNFKVETDRLAGTVAQVVETNDQFKATVNDLTTAVQQHSVTSHEWRDKTDACNREMEQLIALLENS